MGRYTLAVGVAGGAKKALKGAIAYASERKQFKTPVIQFGALRKKVAEAAAGIYAMETLSYRVAGLVDQLTDSLGDVSDEASGKQKMRPIEEYAIEASVAKVFCSDKLNEICGECLQMYGGYGYVEDYPAELAVRDARINMIFEGTNEINRLLIVDMLFKRAMKGRLPLMQWMSSLTAGPTSAPDGPLSAEIDAVQGFKAIAGILLQTAGMKYMQSLGEKQQLVLMLSDIVTECCVLDSVVGRSVQRHQVGLSTQVTDAMARLLVAQAADRVRSLADAVICAMEEGDKREQLRARVAEWTWTSDSNRIADSDIIADATVDAGGYNVSPT